MRPVALVKGRSSRKPRFPPSFATLFLRRPPHYGVPFALIQPTEGCQGQPRPARACRPDLWTSARILGPHSLQNPPPRHKYLFFKLRSSPPRVVGKNYIKQILSDVGRGAEGNTENEERRRRRRTKATAAKDKENMTIVCFSDKDINFLTRRK